MAAQSTTVPFYRYTAFKPDDRTLSSYNRSRSVFDRIPLEHPLRFKKGDRILIPADNLTFPFIVGVNESTKEIGNLHQDNVGLIANDVKDFEVRVHGKIASSGSNRRPFRRPVVYPEPDPKIESSPEPENDSVGAGWSYKSGDPFFLRPPISEEAELENTEGKRSIGIWNLRTGESLTVPVIQLQFFPNCRYIGPQISSSPRRPKRSTKLRFRKNALLTFAAYGQRKMQIHGNGGRVSSIYCVDVETGDAGWILDSHIEELSTLRLKAQDKTLNYSYRSRHSEFGTTPQSPSETLSPQSDKMIEKKGTPEVESGRKSCQYPQNRESSIYPENDPLVGGDDGGDDEELDDIASRLSPMSLSEDGRLQDPPRRSAEPPRRFAQPRPVGQRIVKRVNYNDIFPQGSHEPISSRRPSRIEVRLSETPAPPPKPRQRSQRPERPKDPVPESEVPRERDDADFIEFPRANYITRLSHQVHDLEADRASGLHLVRRQVVPEPEDTAQARTLGWVQEQQLYETEEGDEQEEEEEEDADADADVDAEAESIYETPVFNHDSVYDPTSNEIFRRQKRDYSYPPSDYLSPSEGHYDQPSPNSFFAHPRSQFR
ncbi:hypothetical protein ABW19_dt0206327 [Dactylella cylindrospora]|nr:hypothetical protein ABW19_dt0206327 [Dactylella cylindrospora]